jgi:hypothetical protein
MISKTKQIPVALFLISVIGVTHADTITWDFSGGLFPLGGSDLGAGIVEFTATDGSTTLGAEAFRRSDTASGWDWDSDNAELNQNLAGLGVTSSVDDIGQLDNSGYYELIRVSLGSGLVPTSSVVTLTFSSDDYTIWGNDTGYLPDAADLDPLNGTVIADGQGSGLWTTVDLAATQAFEYLFFATSIDLTDPANDDYRLISLTVSDNNLNVSATPLPAAAWLFGSVLIGAGILRRRSKNS